MSILLDISDSILLDSSALGKINDSMRNIMHKMTEQFGLPRRHISLSFLTDKGIAVTDYSDRPKFFTDEGKWIDINHSQLKDININAHDGSSHTCDDGAFFIFMTDAFSMFLPDTLFVIHSCERHALIISDPLGGKLVGSSPNRHVLGDTKKIHFSYESLSEAINLYMHRD